MKISIKVSVDYTLDFFDLVSWHKQVGDRVRAGDIMLTFETQKETTDKAAEADGVLAEICIPAGENVQRPENVQHGGWGAVVGYIETDEVSPVTEQHTEKKAADIPPMSSALKDTSAPAVGKKKMRARRRPDGTMELVPVEDVVSPAGKAEMRSTLTPDGIVTLVPADKTATVVMDTVTRKADAAAVPSGAAKASPHVRTIARGKVIDLSAVTPTGPNGTITLQDLARYDRERQASPIAPPVRAEMSKDNGDALELVPLTARRKGIATNLTKSWQEIPHAGCDVIVDMSRIAARRARILSGGDMGPDARAVRIASRWDAFIIAAIAENLRDKWRVINSTFTWEGLQVHTHVNVAISLADRHGLIVPVMHRVEAMSVQEVALRLEMIYEGVRQNTLTAKDYRGATFTFNNPGALGGHSGSSIIPYKSGSAILSFHAVDKDQKSIVGLRFDHRAYDGREALGFLTDVKRILENWPETQ